MRLCFIAIGALALLMAGRVSAAPAPAVCPDASLGETPLDCPWAGVARSLIQEGDADTRLPKLLPDLAAQLKADSKRGAWKRLWGRSINFDELAQGEIVSPSILESLARRMGIPMSSDKTPAGHAIVHAGMEHTYGYLFSVLKTSFGYKRARWVEGEIARGFGLPEGLLSPRPSEGSLFANVTWFIGHIAFGGEPARLTALRKGAGGLPKALRDFKFGVLRPVRLEETVTAKDSTGDVRAVTLRTDLVPFTKPEKNSHLLVYSVHDPSRGGAVLITAFPVAQGFVDTVLKPEELGEGKPVLARYNAYVEGLSLAPGAAPLVGARKVRR